VFLTIGVKIKVGDGDKDGVKVNTGDKIIGTSCF